ncbi:hypothetical protein BGLA2_420110 [Burkholderia gladioli]|nr:hypothetical protein BGLA2_420110 [Burkholderia gladioli]
MDRLVPTGHDRQRLFRIAPIQHLLIEEGVDSAETATTSNKTDFCFFYIPVHTCLLGPDFERLLRRKLSSDSMPRFRTDIGHALYQVHFLLQ